MKFKDIFALAVRLLGLVFLYHGLMMVPGVVSMSMSVLRAEETSLDLLRTVFLTPWLSIAWHLFVAWWLIGGAPRLMRLAYPEPEK